jgi:arylsulfatase A-like enzyme
VLPGLLVLVVWLVLLANGFWLVSLNNHVLGETPIVVRILVSVLLAASLATLFITLINVWGSLMHKRKIYVKRLLTVLSLLIILLFVSESIMNAYVKKNSVMPSPSATVTAKKSAMPNIVWIVMDTVRADHLSCYGYHRSTTPRIDKIALESVVFENTFSTAPWTLSAHASMLTGMYPSVHQTTNNHQFLSYSFTTIAELLRANGYMTAAFSNNPWFSPMTNLNQGFDFFFAGYNSAGTGNEWIELTVARLIFKVMHVENEIRKRFSDWKTARQTNMQIEKWLENKLSHDAPFFLFINYMEAHTPYAAPESYAVPFLPNTISYKKAMQVNQSNMLYYAGLVDMSESDFDVLRALYDGAINHLDHYIGNLLDHLRSLNMLDDTIIIITSDHGENFGENKKMGHVFSVDDRLLRVPLIIRYPKKVPAGQRISRPVQVHQIFRTILGLIGIEWPGRNALQGDDLLQKTPSSNAPTSLSFAELDVFYEGIQMINQFNRNCFVDDYARSFKTIRDKQYKYISASDGRDELYDMVKDHVETKNVIKEHPEKAEELRLRLAALFRSFDVPNLKKEKPEIADQADLQTIEALRSLGYVK